MIYTLIWAGWVLAFFIVEGFALKNDMPGDTFSEHTRKWLRVDTKPGRTIFLIMWLGFSGWFFFHILTELF